MGLLLLHCHARGWQHGLSLDSVLGHTCIRAGPYCELMKEDGPRLQSLVSRIRRRYDRDRLDIYNITLTADMPLCEVFFVGPIPELGRIFYARGGTLQVSDRRSLPAVHDGPRVQEDAAIR